MRGRSNEVGCRDELYDSSFPALHFLADGRKSSDRRSAFVRGARAAADVVEQYDGSSTHPHRLGDCVLAKMNIRRTKPRRNRQKLERPEDAWLRGLATALAEMHRRLLHGGDAAGVRAVARGAGVDFAMLRAAGVAAFDLRELRKAGVR